MLLLPFYGVFLPRHRRLRQYVRFKKRVTYSKSSGSLVSCCWNLYAALDASFPASTVFMWFISPWNQRAANSSGELITSSVTLRYVVCFPPIFAWRDNCWDLKSSGLSLLKAWRRKILGSSASSWHVSYAICSFFCRANHCFPVITATLYTFFSQSIAVIISSIPILCNSILI